MPEKFNDLKTGSSLSSRLLDIYRTPQRTYGALRANGGEWFDWVIPTLLAAATWAAFNYGLISGPDDLPRTHAGWEGLSEIERQAARDAQALWSSHVWYSLPLVNSFASLAAVALILMPMCRWLLRCEVTLRQMLAVKAYAAMITIPSWLLLAVFHRLGATDTTFGPAALLAVDERSGFGAQILVGLDLFDLWQAVVIGIGLAVMTKRQMRDGVLLSVSLWFGWVVIGALASLLPTAPPPV